jgi:hypothetical protein
MNDELERIWKDAGLDYLNALSRHWAGGTK